MDKSEEALVKIEMHERECALRMKAIETRLDSGAEQFKRQERMLLAVYPFILGSLVFVEYFR
jgi:hypothetical protein